MFAESYLLSIIITCITSGFSIMFTKSENQPFVVNRDSRGVVTNNVNLDPDVYWSFTHSLESLMTNVIKKYNDGPCKDSSNNNHTYIVCTRMREISFKVEAIPFVYDSVVCSESGKCLAYTTTVLKAGLPFELINHEKGVFKMYHIENHRSSFLTESTKITMKLSFKRPDLKSLWLKPLYLYYDSVTEFYHSKGMLKPDHTQKFKRVAVFSSLDDVIISFYGLKNVRGRHKTL